MGDDIEEGTSTSRWDETRRPLMFRLKGTVILRIWWQILIMAIYTAAVVICHKYIDGMQMNFPLTLVPVLGVVTGLLLVFRTNTAYDRYWEGRRIWSEMTFRIRHLTCSIWAGVDQTVVKAEVGDNEKYESRLIIEKISAIKLLVAFAYATKNYLRQEYSYDEADMKDLINHLPRFQTPSSNQPFDIQGSFRNNKESGMPRKSVNFGSIGLSSSLNSVSSVSQSTNVLFPNGSGRGGFVPDASPGQSLGQGQSKGPGRVKKICNLDEVTPTNIPIEISYYLFSYVRRLGERGIVDPGLMKVMYEALLGLVECLTGFERILRTPIPLAYGVHLHQAVWLYLLALPYQLVQHLNWFTIPAVSLASFALLGILGIGWEIENPFGYDDNDLPLNDFCKVIRREVEVIIGRPLPTLESWVFSKDNHPLAPNSWLGADELLYKSPHELIDILAQEPDLQFHPNSPNGKKPRLSSLSVHG